MHLPGQPFNLAALEDGVAIRQLIEEQFAAPALTVTKVGAGFYAHVYKVLLPHPPTHVIVKCYYYPGYGAQEMQQLQLLRRYAQVPVPYVYALHPFSSTFPYEALSMEYLSGVSVADVHFPDQSTQARFVDSVIANLRGWHTTRNPHGFGAPDGPYYATWSAYFTDRIASYHARLQHEPHRAIVSPYVMQVIDDSFIQISTIFQHASPVACLIHGDYNGWNLLVDPHTYALSGVIDPLDAGWGDPEIDLFHLSNCRPELGLLECYIREMDLDAAFWLRYKFYRFWDDVKHYLRVGWYDEVRFRTYAADLAAAMQECGLSVHRAS